MIIAIIFWIIATIPIHDADGLFRIIPGAFCFGLLRLIIAFGLLLRLLFFGLIIQIIVIIEIIVDYCFEFG